jgi:CRP/FNR family transcriptional regulator
VTEAGHAAAAAAPWYAAIPSLAGLDGAARAVLDRARLLTLPPGAVTFRPGAPCSAFIVLLEGVVRVRMISETGREIVLYRVEPGQTCILTTACLMSRREYSAEAIADTEARAALIARGDFESLMARSGGFRDFVFSSFGERLADMFTVVDEVAFRRIDRRVARFLVDRGGTERTVALSHADLAVELGTAREVVSRQLKEFERRGWVELARGRITVLDGEALDRIARS